MDLTGLFLVAASLSLILLPLSLAPTAQQGWKTPSMVGILRRFFGKSLKSDGIWRTAHDDHRWRTSLSSVSLIRVESPTTACDAYAMACKGTDIRGLFDWICRLCLVFPPRDISVFVSETRGNHASSPGWKYRD